MSVESAWENDRTTRWQMVPETEQRYMPTPGRKTMPGDALNVPTGRVDWQRREVDRRFMAPGSEYSWAMTKTPDRRMVLQQRMQRLGLYPEGAQIVPSMWSPTDAGAMRKVMDFADANGLGVNEALNVMEATGQAPGGSSSSSGGGGGGSHVSTSSSSSSSSSTSTSYNISGKDTARELLRNTLTQQLGRAPTPGETKQFLRQLNRAERADPSTSRSSSSSSGSSRTVSKAGSSHTVSSDSSTSSSVSHTSKVNPSAMAERFGRQGIDPGERNAYQRVLYVDVLSDMMDEG